jgi:tetratricopeptide (TPR) repeat protein
MNPKSENRMEAKEKVRLSDLINNFMRKYRVALAIIGIALITVIAVVGIVSFINHDRLVKSTASLEELDILFEKWEVADESGKSVAGDRVIESAGTLIARFGGTYAALKAGMMQAAVLYERKDYLAAELAYNAIHTRGPKSHLAPKALAGAAVMAEERGDKDKAIGYLQQAITQYPNATGANRVIFTIGRIFEETRQYDKALEQYRSLVAKGQNDDWTKLSQSRIIHVTTLGIAP